MIRAFEGAHMQHRDFTLADFMGQMGQITRLGPMGRWVGMLPGMSELVRCLGGEEALETQLRRMRGIYDSMSVQERLDVHILDAERRRRIARGAGVKLQHVSQFLKQYQCTLQMMEEVGRIGPLRTNNLVAGLVTFDPRRRDPSWLVPMRSPEKWKNFLVLVSIVLALAAAIAVWERLF
jgi:signal recognition particle subunit SRP54